MRPSHLSKYPRGPIVHPILGPTIARPTRLITSPIRSKKPIPISLLSPEQIELPNPRIRSSSEPKTPTSSSIVRRVLSKSNKLNKIDPHPSNLSHLNSWPTNLRVVDGWSGYGRWGEGKPDHREWMGVEKKHKDLMKYLRAER